MSDRLTEFDQLLARLVDSQVEFIVVGGIAAAAHGAARATYDIDVVYRRSDANLERLVSALTPITPYLRGAPPDLPFRFDVETVRRGLNFTLTTAAGDIDLLGEVTGGGGYDDLLQHTVEMNLFDRQCRCLDLETLIRVKRAAGRPKDHDALAELEALREERAARGE